MIKFPSQRTIIRGTQADKVESQTCWEFLTANIVKVTRA